METEMRALGSANDKSEPHGSDDLRRAFPDSDTDDDDDLRDDKNLLGGGKAVSGATGLLSSAVASITGAPPVKSPEELAALRRQRGNDVVDTVKEVIKGREGGGFSVRGSAEFGARYVVTSTRRDLGTWAIGVVTIFIVVMFLTLLANSIIKSPLIFMRLAEETAGEFDVLLTPSPTMDAPTFFLNASDIAATLRLHSPSTIGAAPRWYMIGRCANRDEPDRIGRVIFVVADMEREVEMGLGRGFPYRPLGEGETHITASLLREIGVKANHGERVVLSIDFAALASSFGATDSLETITGLVSGANATTTSTLLQLLDSLATLNSTVIEVPTTDENLGAILAAIGVPPTPTALAAFRTFLVAVGVSGDSLPLNIGAIAAALGIPLTSLQETAAAILSSLSLNTNDFLTVSAEYTVVDAIVDSGGKYPAALGNVAVLEARFVEKLLVNTLNSTLSNPLVAPLLIGTPLQNATQFLATFDINHYALTVVVNARARETIYDQASSAVERSLRLFSDEVVRALGVNMSNGVALPIWLTLGGFTFLSLFLNQLFNAVTVVLTFLGSMLIYSLLLSDVEDKTYDYGMLRALGMRHGTLIQLVLDQALLFALPGIAVGLFTAWLLNVPVTTLITSYALVPTTLGLSGGAIRTGVLIGLFIPLLANYLPIQRALSKSLRDSLDRYHSMASDTIVTIVRLERVGLSAWQTVLAVTMVVLGFVVYYLIPLSFIYQRLSMFFNILLAIMLAMVLGLALLASLAQPYGERLLVHTLVQRDDERLRVLVKKNLNGHRTRNQKTALMFTISVAFLVFAGAQFTLQAELITDTVKLALGSDIFVNAGTTRGPLPESLMREYLNSQVAKENATVEAFTFVTFSLDRFPHMSGTYLSNFASFPNLNVRLFGVEANYLDAVYTEYVVVTETQPGIEFDRVDGVKDVVRSLYDDVEIVDPTAYVPPIVLTNVTLFPEYYEAIAAQTATVYRELIDGIVSEATRTVLNTNVADPLVLRGFSGSSGSAPRSTFYVVNDRAMVRKMPGFTFFKNKLAAFDSPLLVSLPTFNFIMGENLNVTKEGLAGGPFWEKLYVKMKDGTGTFEREAVINGLRNFVNDDTIQFFDTIALLQTTAVAVDMILLFFNICALINAILSFFVLFLSFTANIRENSWEFGVLRSLGLSAQQVLRVYIYEALCLVVTALVLGTTVGLLTALTLTLQYGLFTEAVFHFTFPWVLYLIVVVASLTITLVGSYLPARAIMRNHIAATLKG